MVFTLEKNGRTVQEIYNTITEQGYKGPYSSVRVLVTEIRRKRKQRDKHFSHQAITQEMKFVELYGNGGILQKKKTRRSLMIS